MFDDFSFHNFLTEQVLSVVAVLLLAVVSLLVMLLVSVKRQRSYFATLQDLRGEYTERIDQLQDNVKAEQINSTRIQGELSAAQQNTELLAQQLEKAQMQLEQLNREYNKQAEFNAGETQRLQTEKQALLEKLESLEKNRKQMSDEFELLANRIFDEKAQRFAKASESQMQTTLAPLKDQIGEFRKRVDQVYTNEAKERHALAEQINRLREESVRISEDASNLTKALRQDNKAQGNWGELTLLSALEMCGLREGIEFDTQVAITEDGVRSIPDVVVHLPGAKDIVIDSKVSLMAYTRYFESEEPGDQSQAIEQHLLSVRNHVKNLSGKNYSALHSLNTLDYVMLYIPVEGASSLALQNDPELWNFAYSKNIVLVGPSNLLAILRSVETIWRHERQNKNAEKIATEAGKLHDQFVLFAESLEEVGKQIDRARGAYDKAQERLTSGRGNLLRRVENLEKLGARTHRKIPEKLLSAADDGSGADQKNHDANAPNTVKAITENSEQADQLLDTTD